MKNVIKVSLFTLGLCALYTGVGQWVPQKEVHPPKALVIDKDLDTAGMIQIGKKLLSDRGCYSCHTENGKRGERAPDLVGIGARAKTRIKGYSDVDYLAEALFKPNAYLVPAYKKSGSMPPVNTLGVSNDEALTIIAYLQSLGGKVTVTMSSKLKFSASSKKADASKMDGKALFGNYVCNACHQLAGPGKMVGPSLYDVGKRLSEAEIKQSIMEPDAVIAKGYPKGIMGATLKSAKFFEKITPEQLKILVDFLAKKKG